MLSAKGLFLTTVVVNVIHGVQLESDNESALTFKNDLGASVEEVDSKLRRMDTEDDEHRQLQKKLLFAYKDADDQHTNVSVDLSESEKKSLAQKEHEITRKRLNQRLKKFAEADLKIDNEFSSALKTASKSNKSSAHKFNIQVFSVGDAVTVASGLYKDTLGVVSAIFPERQAVYVKFERGAGKEFNYNELTDTVDAPKQSVETGTLAKFKQITGGVLSMESSCLTAAKTEKSSSVFEDEQGNEDYLGYFIGKYFIEKLLGQGSFGRVFLGKLIDGTSGPKYAIKELTSMNIRDRENAEKEADLMQKLRDENIAEYVESFSIESIFYLVLGFCNAGDLNDLVKTQSDKNKEWRNGDIQDCFKQIVSGLLCLHSHRSADFPGGVLHRDLKPGNVLVCKSPVGVLIFKIADFGLARVMEDSLISANTLAGTKLYMAPEVLKEDETYSFPNDIWALGCILYEICTLKRAFQRENGIWKIIHNPTAIIPTISNSDADDWIYREELSTLCSDLLVLDAKKRPKCSELLERVKGLKGVPDLEEEYAGKYDAIDVSVTE